MIGFYRASSLLAVFHALATCCLVRAQSPIEFTQNIEKLLQPLRGDSALSFEATVSTRRNPGDQTFGHVHFERLDKQVYLEIWDCEADDRSSARARRDRWEDGLKALGGALPDIFAFDGHKSYSYNAYSCRIVIEEAIEFTSHPRYKLLNPRRWTSFQVPPAFFEFPFRNDKEFKVSMEPAAEGLLRLRAEARNEELGFIEYELLLDPKVNNLPAQYSAKGRIGVIHGNLKWAHSDSGIWYPQHAQIYDLNSSWLEWDITKISFNAKTIRQSFRLSSSGFPLGTQIVERAGADTKKSYVGGEAGQIEHRKLKAAVTKIRDN